MNTAAQVMAARVCALWLGPGVRARCGEVRWLEICTHACRSFLENVGLENRLRGMKLRALVAAASWNPSINGPGGASMAPNDECRIPF